MVDTIPAESRGQPGVNPSNVQNSSTQLVTPNTHSLLELELKFRPNPYYIENVQTGMTPSMRETLVDWLSDVGCHFSFNPRTLHLSINLLDRYLTCVDTPRGKLQLVGISCVLIASKYEEVIMPELNQLVVISASTYTREQILKMELSILGVLKFTLTVATSRDFVILFLKMENADKLLSNLTEYLVELTLQVYKMMKYSPSVIAASAIRLAQLAVNDSPPSNAPSQVRELVQSNLLEECSRVMLEVWREVPNNRFKAVREKFSSTRYMSVSINIEPPYSAQVNF